MPGRVLRRNIVLRDDSKKLGLHPRGQARRREDGGTTGDSGTMGGRWDDGRMAGRREDGGTTDDSTLAMLGATLGTWGCGGEREWCCWLSIQDVA